MSSRALKELRETRPQDEVVGAELGDLRRTQRAVRTLETMARAADESLPTLAASDSELTGMYRFFNNESVTPEALLGTHREATARRAASFGQVLAIHDTTEVAFTGEREGLGRLSDGRRGFLAHATLVVSADEEALPLGVASLELLTRADEKKERKRRSMLDPQNEFSRWDRGVRAARELLSGTSPIHVMDREGDSYELFASMVGRGERFVVRLVHDRRLAGEVSTLFEAVAHRPVRARRKVEINRRGRQGPPGRLRKHPPRDARTAHLAMSSTRVELRRPERMSDCWPESLSLNVVRVFEPEPPQGQEGVEWLLVTTEPVKTGADVLRSVDWYRRRWTIEEFFKALKTGCSVEKRDFVTAHALMNAFALSIPIAWHLLLMRALARYDSKADAARVFTRTQLEVLHLATRKLPPAQRPPRSPTVRQALLAIAALGGHLKRNGEPGWLTLARGYDYLQQVVFGFQLASLKSARNR